MIPFKAAAPTPERAVGIAVAACQPVTLNDALPAGVNPVAEATKAYPVPIRRITTSLKVATPAVALRVSVPRSVSPVGLLPRDRVIADAYPATVLPLASCATTTTAGR